jgi:long-chain acyl-CoA synthetase
VNLADVLLGAARDTPDAVALLGARGSTSFAELGAGAARLAGVLLEVDVPPDGRVALVSPNSEAFVTAYLATLHAGAICVPLNPSAPPAALERELDAIEPHLVLAAGPGMSLVAAAGHAVQAVDLDALPPDEAPRAERRPDDVAVLLFTSGTAGTPHAAMLTHANLAANLHQVQEHPGLALRADDVGLAALPCFHVFGLNVVVGVGLAAGATTVLVERFDPAAVVQLVGEHGVTVLAGVPTMFEEWLALDATAAPRDAFARIRLAVSGAAPLAAEVAAAFEDRFGVVLHQGYGLTEASPIVTTTALSPTRPRPGSIGRPLPGVAVRLVDEDGVDVLAGDPGEIWVRGPNVFPGYWRDDAATASVLDADGSLHTGDVAVADDDGSLWLVDRRKDLIIVSGFNVYPAEIEEVLATRPDVREAAVVGAPSPRTGETVVAFVVPEPGTDPEPSVLIAHCAHTMARYKCPTRVEFVDALPKNPAGKLVRRALTPD